jgi:23S rRNA (cytidine2498-2'-O)-methyltransferase
VLVEPNEWWIGCHFAARRTDCYPGGVLPLELPPHAVSRAYLKMQEALEWSALPFSRGDVFVELGCAPGGAAQALIERGVQVIGVDPAEVDPAVAELEGFRHVRRRTVDLPRRELAGANWLAADMNVAPNYTLDAVEAIVVHPHSAIRGLVLTLKLADWQLAADVPAWIERIQGWGYRDVRVRQLAHNRQEVCVVALRSRAQRRVRRGRTQRRTDPTQTPQPHLPQQQ